MDWYINEANKKFNNNFDYSQMKTDKIKEKTLIICKAHNVNIKLSMHDHLRRRNGGCDECLKKIVLDKNEIIKDVNITEYKDLYSITSLGNCFSKKTGKKLAKCIRNGYYYVHLYNNNGNVNCHRLHYLVYISFYDDYTSEKVICHIDDNKLNNCKNNLCLAVRVQNNVYIKDDPIVRYDMQDHIKKANEKFDNNFDYSQIKTDKIGDETLIICKTHKTEIKLSMHEHFVRAHGGCTKCQKEPPKPEKIILKENEIIKNVGMEKFKDLYSITSFGRCFSKRSGLELKSHINGGYQYIQLTEKNKTGGSSFTIHKLVYVSFHDDYDLKKVIDHIDGNRLNNNVENLRLVTQSENMRNAVKNNSNMCKYKKINIYDTDEKLIKECADMNECVDYIGIKNYSKIHKCLQNKIKTFKNYIFKYAKDEHSHENTHVSNIENFISIGKIDNIDYSNYLINKNGIVVNKNRNNRIIKPYKNLFGYFVTNITKPFLTHRLIGKYFLKDGEKYYYDKNYVVNHKDENKSNNNIENLEWITKKQNTVYSIGKKVNKIDKDTDQIIETYDSISDALRSINSPLVAGNLTKVCKGERNTCGGFKWKYAD